MSVDLGSLQTSDDYPGLPPNPEPLSGGVGFYAILSDIYAQRDLVLEAGKSRIKVLADFVPW